MSKVTKKSEETEIPVESLAQDFQALYQRALADAENSRKRFEDERKLIAKFAIGDIVMELIPVLENFTRATEHVPEVEKNSPWATGVLYIRKQLMDVLNQRGVTELTAQAGEMFDPNKHEAIGTVLDAEKAEDTIAEVKGMGYQLYERILKAVPVVVTAHEVSNKD